LKQSIWQKPALKKYKMPEVICHLQNLNLSFYHPKKKFNLIFNFYIMILYLFSDNFFFFSRNWYPFFIYFNSLFRIDFLSRVWHWNKTFACITVHHSVYANETKLFFKTNGNHSDLSSLIVEWIVKIECFF
jgi:hypothetical protein